MNNFNVVRILFYHFLIPLIIAFIFNLYFKGLKIPIFCNLIENILFATIILILSFFINGLKYKRLILFVMFLFFNFFLVFETLYYHLFDSILSASAIFVILETNSAEMNEFLSTHIDGIVLVYISIAILLTIYCLIRILKIVNFKRLPTFNKFLLFESLLILYFFVKTSGLIVYNGPYIFIKTPISYFSEMKKFQVYGSMNKLGKFTGIKYSDEKQQDLFVIIIGESTSKRHFNLYNEYYRETTPLLNEIKKELYVFNDVISPHVYTIGALSKALTLGNYENPEGKYKGSILQLFNQANYNTYWISNQRPVGMMDTHITKIGIGADKSIFLNTKHTSDDTTLDSELLDPLNEILIEKGNSKVVFLHLLGTHVDYKKRYPEEDEYFKDKPITNFKNEEAFSKINAYDNAVRYNDKLLRKVIEMVKKQDLNSYVLFFSDHGQEVFDDIDFVGHTIDENITKNMYEIPMFVWLSNRYKNNEKSNFNVNIKYMTDDLFHSIADLSNIKCNEVDSTRSIFSQYFKERKRIVKDTINYDTYFK